MQRNKTILFVLLASIFVGFTTFKNTESEWVLKKQEDGVTVYNRSVSSSALKEIKAVTQIKSSLSSIIALLSDRESFPQWVYKCETAHTVKKIDETEAICYQNVVAPWPIDNRDILINVKVKQDPVTKVVLQKATSVANYLPPVENHIRINVFTATWKLTPLKNGIVNCEYLLLFDPGGSLPAWLINMASTDGPYETTHNMHAMITKEKYQNTHYDFIEKPTF